MTFLGFVVFGGTLKKGSLSAIRSLLAASHHVVMITGGQLPNYPMLINTMLLLLGLLLCRSTPASQLIPRTR